MRWLAAITLLLAGAAAGATRATYGKTLRVAVAGPLPPADPLLADTPTDAALSALEARGLCHLDHTGRIVGDLALEVTRPSPGSIHATLRPGLKTQSGAALTATEVSQSLLRALQSPYRALFFPIRGEGRTLSGAATSAYALDVSLAFAWPDLERSLCHPALGLTVSTPHGPSGLGPFAPTRGAGVFTANLHTPMGRPYVDRLSATATDQRGAARAFGELKIADVALGAQGGAAAGPLLSATYLAFRPERVPKSFRQAVESTVDPVDLTRFFVRPPCAPMTRLLPQALMPNDAASPPPRPAPEAKEVTLWYDAGIEDQRQVAERIQVRLHDLGYPIILKATPRAALREKWAAQDFDAMLANVLLPPVPGPALAIALDLGGRHDLLAAELPAIGGIADAAARDQKARERALALGPSVPLIPLYAQGLSIQASPRVEGLAADAFGLPLLDDAFLTEP